MQSVFLAELGMQCRFVVRGASHLDRAMAQVRAVAPVDATTEIWLALQTILVSAANMSRLLCGSGGRHEVNRGPARTDRGRGLVASS